MKRKSNLIKMATVLVCLLCLAMTAMAQKRKPAPRKPAARPAKTVPAATISATNTAEIKSGAEKVSIQIKNVTRFIYLLGGIAQGIEDVDNDIKARKATTAAADLNAKNKASVIATLRNLRAGLASLETEFRANPALRTYLNQIQGITDISGTAEDQAMAGQFIQSGKTLLQVVERLSDTLVAMP
jgi:hypothetical protein